MRNHLFSTVQFLMVAALLALGAFFVALPSAPSIRFELATFLMNQPDSFLSLGLLMVAVGLILLVGLYWMDHKQFFQVTMQASSHTITIEEALIRNSLMTYWKRTFPGEDLHTDIVIHGDEKIELIAELPQLRGEEHKATLVKLEKEVGALLARQFGYEREFLFTFVLK